MNYFNKYAIDNNKPHPIAELFSDAIKKCEMLPASIQCTETVIAIQKCKDAVGELLSTLKCAYVEPPTANVFIGGELIDHTKCSEKHNYCAKKTAGICDNPNGCFIDKYSSGTPFTPPKPWNPVIFPDSRSEPVNVFINNRPYLFPKGIPMSIDIILTLHKELNTEFQNVILWKKERDNDIEVTGVEVVKAYEGLDLYTTMKHIVGG